MHQSPRLKRSKRSQRTLSSHQKMNSIEMRCNLYNLTIRFNEEDLEEEEEVVQEVLISDKEFYKQMQKLKERGGNAVPPKKSASAYIIFGKEV
jgi:hypothetical protein